MLFTFYLLVISHLVADFILQGSLGLKKRGVNQFMLAHCAIATLVFLIPLLGYPLGKSLLGALLIFISHLLVDNLKKEVNLLLKLNPEKYVFWAAIGIDQILHITAIFFIFQFLFY